MRALALRVVLWLVSPAQAAAISVHYVWGIPVVDIDGEIELGDAKKFSRFLGSEGATVRLNSMGGNVAAAIEIGEMVWKRGYTTLVARDNGPCASACTYIWLSGRKSAIQQNSLLCFHQAYNLITGQPDAAGDQLIMDHLKSVGLTNRQAWALTHAAPPDPNNCRAAMEWWARELGFQYQVYPSFLGTRACSARWCVGKP
jgi:hypothetical protein